RPCTRRCSACWSTPQPCWSSPIPEAHSLPLTASGVMPHMWGNPHFWPPHVGVHGARPCVRAPWRRACAYLLRIGKPHKNSHLAAVLGVRVGAGGPLAQSLLFLQDNGGWLRESWPTGARRRTPSPTIAPRGACGFPQHTPLGGFAMQSQS